MRNVKDTTLTMSVSRVLEGANRAFMALDEHLHAGSTLYIPTGPRTSITIAKYVWPGVTGAVTMIILVLRLLWPDLVERDPQRMRIWAMGWAKHSILELAGLSILPLIAPLYGQSFTHYVMGVVAIYATALLVVVPLT